MKLVIIGCGRLGRALALNTCREGHEVTVVDRDAKAFERLGDAFRGRTVQGDALHRETLERAGVPEADGVAVVTPNDATNLVIARTVATQFQVPNVVARLYDPVHRPLFEALGIQTVASTVWGAERLRYLLTHPGLMPLGTFGHGEVELVELRVPEAWHGRTLEDLYRDVTLHPAVVVRAGHALLPTHAHFALHSGDLLVLAASQEALERLKRMLAEAA